MDPIGPLQLRVMQFIWSNGPSTVHQVHDALNAERGAPQLAYTTILTVMRNLAKRSVLDQQAIGRSHQFEPLVSLEEYRNRLLLQVAEDFFDGDVAAMGRYVSRKKAAINAAEDF